jgi:phytoene dehydrogenase-like protein
MNLALNKPPVFACRTNETIEYARTAATLDGLEKAFDEAKYGRSSPSPVLDIHIPTVSSPELAPEGHAVASILVHYIPYNVKDGWDKNKTEQLGDTVLEVLEQHAHGIGETVVAREMLSPLDLETRYGLVQGHIYHGEHTLDQLIARPTPECSGYKTPIPGLFLCGSGSHPGGGITCGPGALAASVIART